MSILISATDQVTLPDAPAIPGLCFRHFRGPEDYPVITAILAGSKEADQDDHPETLEDVQRDYENLVNCDPCQDVVIAEVEGQAIGYGRVFWIELADGGRVYLQFTSLLPAWRETEIRRALLHHNEYRARAIAATHPASDKRYLQTWASETETDWRRLVEEEGYQPVRYGYLMVRPDLADIPDLPLPAGLEVRPVRQEDHWPIYHAAMEAFRDHWDYSEDDWTPSHFEAWMEMATFMPHLWQVAWEGDEIAGMILNYIDAAENTQNQRLRGYTETICVRRPWRKRGLARALLARSLRVLKDLGMAEAALGVDSQNPNGARQLYESMGFRKHKVFTAYRKPLAIAAE